MKRTTRWVLGVAVLSTVGAFGITEWSRTHRVWAAPRSVQNAPTVSPIVPATIVFNEILSAPGKETILSTERTYAIRADGSEIEIDKQHRNDGTVYLTHWRLEGSDGTRAQGDDQTRTMIAVKRGSFGEELALSRWSPQSNCTVQFSGVNRTPEPIARETILGIETNRIVKSDSPTARITVWRAPSLNCIELRRLAEFKNADGSIKDTSDMVAGNIVLGEPSGALFLLPVGYENISFSARHRRMVTAMGGQVREAEMVAIQQQDPFFEKYKMIP